jgi:hypothetical protein
MRKYELPSGEASVERTPYILGERNYTYPLSKKNITKALTEALDELWLKQNHTDDLEARLKAEENKAAAWHEVQKNKITELKAAVRFNPVDVIKVAHAMGENAVNAEYQGDRGCHEYLYVCNYCDVEQPNVEDFKHKLNCPVLVAFDLCTLN